MIASVWPDVSRRRLMWQVPSLALVVLAACCFWFLIARYLWSLLV